MKGTKYLSDAIHMNDIYSGMLNIVTAPVGCGKTYWALNVLSQTVSRPYKMVYLIDTVNGKEQLLKHPNTQFYNRDWCETVRNGSVWFSYTINIQHLLSLVKLLNPRRIHRNVRL